MPPSIPRSSLRALSRCRQSASVPIRSFSTTSPVSAIGPENPKFIEIPVPPQQQALPKLDIKGTLPPPRKIFDRAHGLKRIMKTIEQPSLEAFLLGANEETGLQGQEAAAVDPEVAAKANAEARMGLQRFIKSLDFKAGEPVDYSTAIEKPLQAIAKRAQEIEGRKDREHELQSLKQHAHQLITWPQYFSKVTPESTSQSEPANEYVAWKRRMATSRRENLRAGLVQLSYRKAAQDQTVVHHARKKQREREKLVNAPQREDERLTNPTIREAVRTFQTGNAVPDPNREARVAASAARVKAKEIQREERRRDALHTLYMHARDFIVTEKQLDDKIEALFTDSS